MLALLSATETELSDLRRSMTIEEVPVWQDYKIYHGKCQNKDVLLVQTGIGKERAQTATRFVLERYPVTELVSFGFAGGLSNTLNIGDIIISTTLCCGGYQKPITLDLSKTDVAFSTSNTIGFHEGRSVTVNQPILTPETKRAIGKSFQADIVDMESYWIAEIAAANNIPFLSIRAISDTVWERLPNCDSMISACGSLRLGNAFLYAASHPHSCMKLFVLSRHVRQARQNLTNFIGSLVANYATEKVPV